MYNSSSPIRAVPLQSFPCNSNSCSSLTEWGHRKYILGRIPVSS
jgi:hypothetical protein